MKRRVHIDMDMVRAMHAQGATLKSIAATLSVAYNTLGERTTKAGLRFKNCPKARPKPKRVARIPPPPVVVPTAQDRTRTILDLYEERERAATWWDRDAITQQIEALRA